MVQASKLVLHQGGMGPDDHPTRGPGVYFLRAMATASHGRSITSLQSKLQGPGKELPILKSFSSQNARKLLTVHSIYNIEMRSGHQRARPVARGPRLPTPTGAGKHGDRKWWRCTGRPEAATQGWEEYRCRKGRQKYQPACDMIKTTEQGWRTHKEST